LHLPPPVSGTRIRPVPIVGGSGPLGRGSLLVCLGICAQNVGSCGAGADGVDGEI